MRNKTGNVCMILGAALIMAALSLFLWNRRENNAAGASSEKILSQIMEQTELLRAENETGRFDPYDTAMTEAKIDGYAWIGYLSLPSIERELPVMSEWDYTRLKMAPCRYSGAAGSDDLVICAHNYDRHFGTIKNLASGDPVYFTDMDGAVWQYEVETVEVLAPTDADVMLANEYDLTLFTCTYGGKRRVTVRCRHGEDAPQTGGYFDKDTYGQ